MRPFALAAGCALSLASACSPYVQRGETLYYEGRYIEAAEVFEYTEARLADSTATVRAEYGVYRGLTFLRLDDLASARHWLGYAYAIEREKPGVLDSSDHTLLVHGWAELEQRQAAIPAAPSGSPERMATSDSDPVVRAAAGNGRRSVESQ